MIYLNFTKLRKGEQSEMIGKLEQMLMEGKITEEEYKERKATYVETILELYCLGILTKDQMQDKLNF